MYRQIMTNCRECTPKPEGLRGSWSTTGHDLTIDSHEKPGISLVITFLPLTFQLEEVGLLFGLYEEESHSFLLWLGNPVILYFGLVVII